MQGESAMSPDDLRKQLPVTERWAFMDHAAVAPITEPARRAMCEYAEDIARNGDVYESQWTRRVEEVRQLAGRLINADPLDICFIKNTSEGIDFVAEGLPWQSGDNVIIAEEEYPANIYPWMNLASRGVELRFLESRERRLWIDDLRSLMDGRTRLVSLSFVEFASGFRNDLTAISSLCRERGVLFFVDAIQGLGGFPLDVGNTPIDFLSADGHKWLLGPEGAGLFYLRRDLVDLLRPVAVGWHSVVRPNDFSTIDFRLKPHAGRYESGTLNVAGITALGASMELLLGIGIEKIASQVLQLTDYVSERLASAGFEVYSSRRAEDKSGIVSILVPGRDPRQVVRQCRDAGIVINQRAGRLRVSPHCYNTTEELDRLVTALRS
jgi:selenocysteine lyase/cysteine desulfurase